MILAIGGPIASGKSTLARAVVRELERRGRSATALDLDVLYEVVADDPKNDAAIWAAVRVAADALAGALPVDVVVIDGAALRADRTVTLTVPFGEALRRAQLDPTRGVSRDPDFLRRHYEEERSADGFVLDTSALTVEDCARRVADYAG